MNVKGKKFKGQQLKLTVKYMFDYEDLLKQQKI